MPVVASMNTLPALARPPMQAGQGFRGHDRRVGCRTQPAPQIGAGLSLEHLAGRQGRGEFRRRPGRCEAVARHGPAGSFVARFRCRRGRIARDRPRVRGIGARLVPGAAARRGRGQPRAVRRRSRTRRAPCSKIFTRATRLLRWRSAPSMATRPRVVSPCAATRCGENCRLSKALRQRRIFSHLHRGRPPASPWLQAMRPV